MRRPILFVATPKTKSDDHSLTDFVPNLCLVSFQVLALVASVLSGTLVAMPVAAACCVLSIASNAALIPTLRERFLNRETIVNRNRDKVARPGGPT
jgi:hypothetical protein